MTPAAAINDLLESSDLIMVEGKAYLLAPVSRDQLDALAAYGAGSEDMEPGHDAEAHGADVIPYLDRVTGGAA